MSAIELCWRRRANLLPSRLKSSSSLRGTASFPYFPRREASWSFRRAIAFAGVKASNENAFEVQPNSLTDASIAVPVDHVLALLLSPSSAADIQESLLSRTRDEPRSSEVLWLTNGDRRTGGFLGLTEQKVRFQRDRTEAALERSGIVAIGFDPAIVNYPSPKEPFLELTFVDGSRLGVSDCKIERGRVVATMRFGAQFRAALAHVARIHVRSGSVAYLRTERKPKRSTWAISDLTVATMGAIETSKDGYSASVDNRTIEASERSRARCLLTSLMERTSGSRLSSGSTITRGRWVTLFFAFWSIARSATFRRPCRAGTPLERWTSMSQRGVSWSSSPNLASGAIFATSRIGLKHD